MVGSHRNYQGFEEWSTNPVLLALRVRRRNAVWFIRCEPDIALSLSQGGEYHEAFSLVNKRLASHHPTTISHLTDNNSLCGETHIILGHR